ncbi:hypothetical protein [Actinomadura macrotermitis]|uniref:Uncharacterized protein n=1 Tax=Actinomadura macrotermitis TaxID=2585200 RepID=A0A7K0BV30_9ACTN|nr:hypothetical protein [Actinomadura macrotermitis]MQY05013.1 hypothetical protein [Actinomadura macrotermitis]
MIPIYTTDHIPIAGAGPVEQAWPVWTDAADIGLGLDQLAHAAVYRGAHAIVGLQVTTISPGEGPSRWHEPRYVLVGTAVVTGTP